MSNPPTIDIAGPPHAPEVLATERTSCASELRRPPLGGDQPRPLGSTICGRTWMHVIFRDTTLFKVVYGWGLRRRESVMLDLPDFTANPAAPQLGRLGCARSATARRCGAARRVGGPVRVRRGSRFLIASRLMIFRRSTSPRLRPQDGAGDVDAGAAVAGAGTGDRGGGSGAVPRA